MPSPRKHRIGSTMKDYSHLPDSLVSATRSIIGYSTIYQILKRNRYRLHPLNSTRFNLELLQIIPVSLTNQISLITQIVRKYGFNEFLDACMFVHNGYMRTTRLKQRLSYMLDNYENVYFVTLTLNDLFITLPYKNLLSHAKSMIKDSSSVYVLNSDSGDKNGRLHFHAVITNDKVDIKNLWIYGFVKIEKINNTEVDKRKVSRYCTKLARHAVKDTAFDLVYSRIKKIS